MSLVEKALEKLQLRAPRQLRGSVGPSLVEKTLEKLRVRGPRQPLHGASQSHAGIAEAVPPARAVNFSLAGLRAAGLLPSEDEAPRFAQEYRQIKRPLIGNAIGRGATRLPNGCVIMVASSLPGEGKTFTAINLALSMSREKDVHVLLVDGDVAKPHISRLLSLNGAPGLLDVLRNPQLDVESVIVPTDVPNLWVLPAGTNSHEATELLASARMEEVTRALVQHDGRRVVLFDSPPLLLTTESHALAQVAGQVVMVVRAAATPQQTVLAALSHLGEHRAVSLVLNHDILSPSEAHYYGGYPDISSEPSPLPTSGPRKK